MRVLVTGHHGYIGSVLAPFLAEAGHDVVGLDTELFRGCDFGSGRRWIASRVADVAGGRAGRTLRASTPIVHLAALSNDPLGDLDASLTDGDQPRRHASGSRGQQARLECAGSFSPRPARCTAPRRRTRRGRRGRRPEAADRLRRVEGAFGGGTRLELAGPDFAPVSMRNATVFGASPRLRLDIVLNNLAAWAHTTGAHSPPERRVGLEAPRARAGRREERRLRCSTRLRS